MYKGSFSVIGFPIEPTLHLLLVLDQSESMTRKHILTWSDFLTILMQCGPSMIPTAKSSFFFGIRAERVLS